MRRLPGDTIAAISTALGPGAIAVVRLSGDDAIEIGDRVFRGRRSLGACPGHTVHLGHVVDGQGHRVDEVLATVLRAPNTYTTEHMIEFSCHGGSVPAREVLRACLDAGARQAGPGEFTERAFMNGRMDLVQAEAVADVVAAKTRRGLDLALGQLEGGLSSRLGGIRDALIDMRASVEAAIDFPDDVDEVETRREVLRRSHEVRLVIEDLLRNCDLGVAVREGITVAIVGKPNVGKSSLMNALLARDRSIVTDAPGTTRDAIEEYVNLDGVPFRLIDTAGWRLSDDVAERAGVERARTAADAADLCLLVVDVSQAVDEEDRAVAGALDPGRVLVAGNKSDLGQLLTEQELTWLAGEATEVSRLGLNSGTSRARGTAPRVSVVSAKCGSGLEALRSCIVEMCLGAAPGSLTEVSNVRHVSGLGRVLSCLNRLDDAAGASPFEIVGTVLADATDELGELTGDTTPEQVIERIFARFCIGK